MHVFLLEVEWYRIHSEISRFMIQVLYQYKMIHEWHIKNLEYVQYKVYYDWWMECWQSNQNPSIFLTLVQSIWIIKLCWLIVKKQINSNFVTMQWFIIILRYGYQINVSIRIIMFMYLPIPSIYTITMKKHLKYWTDMNIM